MGIVDHYTQHAVQLQRFAAHEQQEILKAIERLDKKIAAVLNRGLRENATFAEVAVIQENLRNLIGQTYTGPILTKLESDMAKLTKLEIEYQTASLKEFTPTPDEVARVSVANAVATASAKPFEGRTLTAWANDIGADKFTQIQRTVQFGVTSGDSVAVITSEVKKVVDISNNHVKTITRDFVSQYAKVSRDEVFAANEDLIDGTIWVSTLDARTTSFCAVRDGLRYDANQDPIGHGYEYGGGPGAIHHACRSTEVPNVKGVELTGFRPSVGASSEYQKGDNLTSKGTVRKRGDQFKPKRVKGTTRYETWLKTQPKAFQQDVLGVERAKAFRGGASLEKLTDPFGSPLTLQQLAERSII